jgi:CHAT domain-containing protein
MKIKQLLSKFSIRKNLVYYGSLVVLTFACVTTVVPAIAINNSSIIVEQAMSNNPTALLVEGKKYYEQGQFSRAVSAWQQASQNYQQQGDTLNQALIFNYLSLAYQSLGQWQEAQNAINRTLELLQSISDTNSLKVKAKAYNTQGSLQLALGQTQSALESWQTAENLYTQLGDETGIIGGQINQSQALQNLGLYRRSQKLLEEVQQKLQNQADSPLKATGLRSLGVALQTVGDLEKAETVLQQSLTISENLADSGNVSLSLFSLGNLAQSLNDLPTAVSFYQRAANNAPDSLSKIEAQINQFSLLLKLSETETAFNLYQEINTSLQKLPPSRRVIYAKIHLANSIIQNNFRLDSLSPEIITLLSNSVKQARELKDTRAESYGMGTLGKLYEQQQQWQTAQKFTQKALDLALTINSDDISYQWQWQLGRLAEKQGKLAKAIASETVAVQTLQGLRNDLVAMNPDIQFSFQESVEPLYRDLARLLLTPEEKTGNVSPENIEKARNVLESLQLAELENFFREACLDTKPKQIEQIDQKAAVIYSMILEDRLAVIASLPNQTFSYYETALPKEEIEQTLDQLLQSFNPAFSNQIRLQLSEKVYGWMVQPLEAKLKEQNIETLVFVLDGMLRNLPISALYDGQQYLIEKYQVALTPGLQLTDPQTIASQDMRAVLAGVSKPNQGYIALPGVETEISEIAEEISSSALLNQNFTQSRFREQIAQTPAPIIHLATHGQFSSNPEETFVVAWEDTIKVKDFQLLLRSREEQGPIPVELLVLSACQTAEGDKKAALGLAGMAVRSGARSTIATLWAVKDESTAELMTEFYHELSETNTSISKAGALRQAQLHLVKSSNFNHPFYWAPFVLVGNWT